MDNPVWRALTTRQAGFAMGGEYVKRYPSQMAPFVAVPEGASPSMHDLAHDLAQLVEGDELVCLVGVA
ncbi:MAG: GNAT family N-acetyltransferase, partial [Blastocatellia bacterium]